jgi:hypothetical protein
VNKTWFNPDFLRPTFVSIAESTSAAGAVVDQGPWQDQARGVLILKSASPWSYCRNDFKWDFPARPVLLLPASLGTKGATAPQKLRKHERKLGFQPNLSSVGVLEKFSTLSERKTNRQACFQHLPRVMRQR